MPNTLPYANAIELRDQTNKKLSDDDPNIARLILAASRSIDRACNRPDGFIALATATARTFSGSGRGWLWIDECVAITAVAVKESVTDTTYTAWAATDWFGFTGDPQFPDFNTLPYQGIMVDPSGDYTHFYNGLHGGGLRGFAPDTANARGAGAPTVSVTARWGFSVSVPADIKQACIIQAARWFKRGESAWADTAASVDMGQLLYTKAVDPDIKRLLEDGRYIKPVGAGKR